MFVPKIIFLDAVGTLFHTQGSVGHNYANFLANYDIFISELSLNQAFIEAFKAAPEPAFGVIDSPKRLASLEKEWWHQVVLKTLTVALKGRPFPDFEEFFDRVYDHFETASAWTLYPDVLPTLKTLTQQGIQLGVISNFDSRLLKVLQALEIAHFFQSVTLSSQVGVAKPDPIIFQAALNQASGTSNEVIHVGDQYLDDYQGAVGAGMAGRWLNRARSDEANLDASQVIYSLNDLHW